MQFFLHEFIIYGAYVETILLVTISSLNSTNNSSFLVIIQTDKMII